MDFIYSEELTKFYAFLLIQDQTTNGRELKVKFIIYAIIAKNFIISNGSPGRLAKYCCHPVGILLPGVQRSFQDDTGKITI